MKIILEKKDVIELLGKALNTTLDPTNVQITTEPFEVIVMEADKVLKSQEPPEEKKEESEPVLPRKEMTEADSAILMGVSDQLVKLGSPNPVPSSVATAPPPTKGGREV